MNLESKLVLVVSILERLHAVSVASLSAVPAMFRPAGVAKQLDEIEGLLTLLRKAK